MRKKTWIAAIVGVLLLTAPQHAFAESTANPIPQEAQILRFQSITSATFVLKFSGSIANLSVYVTPKISLDYVTIDAKLYKSGDSTPTKTWAAQKIYADSLGDFNFMKSASVSSRGTYYFVSTIKCYSGGTLVETFTGESVKVAY